MVLKIIGSLEFKNKDLENEYSEKVITALGKVGIVVDTTRYSYVTNNLFLNMDEGKPSNPKKQQVVKK